MTAANAKSETTDVRSATLRVLGGFELRDGNGRPIELKARKSRQLLAYLAIPSDQTRTREQLAALLWSDRQDEQARGSLRTALSGIRRAIGDDALIVENDTVKLRSGYLDTDYDELKRPLETDANISKLDDFYSGELLAGQEHESELYTDWLRGLRGECVELAMAVLEDCADKYSKLGEYKTAINLMRESLSLEPLKEQTHRAIMQLYAANGEKAMALAQFRTCKEVLLHELDTGPDPETQALADSIALRDVDVSEELLNQVGSVPEITASPVSSAEIADDSTASIAVLPFVNMSGDAEQNYFTDGITEDIIIDLCCVETLSVAAKSSSDMYRGAAFSAADISEQLGVRYLLQGSVRTSGENVRISALLIDAATNRQIWAKRYDRTLDKVFELQTEISQAIVDALKMRLNLSPHKASNIRTTTNGEAYEYYLHGKSVRKTRLKPDNELAIVLFERAITLDSNFSLAHAALAQSMATLAAQRKLNKIEMAVAIENAMEHVEKALQIDPLLAEAHLARGYVFSCGKVFHEVKKHYTISIELDPELATAHFYLGNFYLQVKDELELAYASFERAFLRDPELQTCQMLLTTGFALGYSEELQSYATQILNLARRQFALNSHDFVAAHLVAYASYLLGNQDDAKLWTNIAASFDINDRFFLYNLACLYSLLGEIDNSLETLERWSKFKDSHDQFHYTRVVDPDLELVRKDTRFDELLARYELER